MPVCGYVVLPRAGQAGSTAQELSRLPGCQVYPAENRELLLLVTDTDSFSADEALRARVEALDGVQALLLTFGEIQPADADSNPFPGEAP